MSMGSSTRGRWNTGVAVGAGAVALSAAAGAAGLVTGGLSIGTRFEARLPFGSPVLGGLALAAVVCLPFGLLAARSWRSDRRTGFDAMVVGGLLIAWLLVQLAFIRELSFFHPLFLAVAIATMAAGWVLTHAPQTRDEHTTVDRHAVDRFLGQRRIAVIGASSDPRRFGHTVFRAFVDHGYDVVPVNRRAAEVGDVRALPSVGDVEPPVDGAVIMLSGPDAMEAVHECIAAHVPRVWLFRGAGSPGALSAEAVDDCRAAGIDVIAGACPLMFLGPVAAIHRMHLTVRHLDGSLVGAPA